jgi:hypothetical protein
MPKCSPDSISCAGIQAEAKHLEAQALLASARAQLEAANKEHASLQGQIQQGMAAIYAQARSLASLLDSFSEDVQRACAAWGLRASNSIRLSCSGICDDEHCCTYHVHLAQCPLIGEMHAHSAGAVQHGWHGW